MPPKSRIDALPPELRAEFDRFLASRPDLSITDLTGWVNERLASEGVSLTVSRSAVGRYSQSFEQAASKIRESREIAGAFARELGEAPDGDMGRVLVELMHGIAFKAIMARADGEAEAIDTLDVGRLAKAIKDLAAGTKISVDIEAQIREQARKEMEDEARKKIGAAVDDKRLDPQVAEEALRVMGFV